MENWYVILEKFLEKMDINKITEYEMKMEKFERLRWIVDEHKQFTFRGHDDDFDSGYSKALQYVLDQMIALDKETVDEATI